MVISLLTGVKEVEAVQARGGSAAFKECQNLNFYAGDVYVKCEYGVDCQKGYVYMEANDLCDFSINGNVYDIWGLEYILLGGAEQSYFAYASRSNQCLDQMVKVEATVRADGPETGTTCHFDYDFTSDFYK